MLQPFVALIQLPNQTMAMLPIVAADGESAIQVAAHVCTQADQPESIIMGLLNEADVSSAASLIEQAKRKIKESGG